MSILGTFNKQPAEVLDYDVDFTSWLGSDTIVSQTSTVSPSGALTITQSSIMSGSKVVKNVCSGGTHGTRYKVTVQITTATNLIKQAEFNVSVKEI
jgi:hypothetical protein